MTVFTMPVFDATVVFDGNELFKGRGAAEGWAKRVAAEFGSEVSVRKIGSGWVLCGTVDGVERVWGVYGQRLKQIDRPAP